MLHSILFICNHMLCLWLRMKYICALFAVWFPAVTEAGDESRSESSVHMGWVSMCIQLFEV